MTSQAMTCAVVLSLYEPDPELLSQQVRSLAAQTHPPDELVIQVDDESTDVDAVRETFAAIGCQLSFETNRPRLGYARSFMRALERVKSDVVLLCDQDDVWNARKIEKVVAEFSYRPDVTMVVHCAEVVTNTDYSLGLIPPYSRALNRLLRGYLPPFVTLQGVLLAFRASSIQGLGSDVLPPSWFHSGGMGHDAYLTIVASAAGQVGLIDEPLVRYVRHPGTSTGHVATQSDPHRPGPATADAYRGLQAVAAAVSEDLARLAPRSIDPVRFESRASQWRHAAEVFRLRAKLYSPLDLRERVRTLAALLLSGAYGRGPRGVLGVRSLCKDVVTGLFRHRSRRP